MLPAGLARLIRFRSLFLLDRPANIIAAKDITSRAILKTSAKLDRCPAASAAPRAGGSNGYRWITGPITTVRDGRMSPKALADTRVVLSAWKWFSERRCSSPVVLGNHTCSVRRTSVGQRVRALLTGN